MTKAAPETDAAGALFAGRFEVVQKLGSGGFGTVYEVLDRESDERLALKELRTMDAASLYRFKQEFRSLADISHPNLIALRELHGAGERWFFTMELVEGHDFWSHLRPAPELATALTMAATTRWSLPTVADPSSAEPLAPRPVTRFELDEARLRSALVQLARGVVALHASGKLHCDLKPSNVLIDGSGRLVILDFGLVTDTRAGGLEDHLHVAGTPVYMSPEHVRGDQLSPASDWYSVGIMLFEALTGYVPHQGDSITDILASKLVGDVLDPRASTLGIPDDLAEICVGLTRLDPVHRIDGSEVLAKLGAREPARSVPSHDAWLRAHETHAVLGREPQLEALHEAHRQLLASPRAFAVHLHGVSGMGKTALVRRFTSELRDAGTLVLEGRCFERESVPYNAFDSLIDALTDHLARRPAAEVEALVGSDAHALARLFPVIEHVAAISAQVASNPAAPDPHEVRARAFRALRTILDRLARERPLVLSIDDLHWGDADSAALLEELLREPDPPPLLLVASFRTESRADSPVLGVLAGVPSSEIRLGPLSQHDARELAFALIGEDESALSAELIARESGGSPLFVAELVRYARDSVLDGAYSLRTARETLSLDRVLGARIERLPAAARSVLEIVATMGEPIRQATALQAAGVTSSRHETIAALRRADLLQRSAGSEADRIETFHDRVREAVLERLEPDARRARHLELARALAASDPSDPEAIARHFQSGGDDARAGRYAVLAAERAAAAFAFDRAVGLYRVALELAAPEDRSELRVRLADALVNAGRGAEAAEEYLAAVSGTDPHRSIDLRRRAAEHFLRAGRIDQGLSTLRDVLSEVGLSLPATRLGVLASIAGARARLVLGGLHRRRRHAREVPADVLLRADACASAALGLGMVDVIRGSDFQTRHLLLALDAGEPRRLAVSLALNAMSAASGGRSGRARASRMLAYARELAAGIDEPYVDGLIQAGEGVTAFIGGGFPRARAHLARAERIFGDRCVGTDFHRVVVQLFSIAARFYLGELEELDERVSRYLLEAEQRGDLYAEVNLQIAAGNMAWLVRDEPEEAARRASHALAAWSREGYLLQHWYALRSLAQIDLYRGDGAGAWERTRREWRSLERSLIARAEHIFVETRHLRGRVALAAGALDEAERAANQLRRVGAPWSTCFALLLDAGIAARRGDASRAESVMRHAIARCETADLRLHAAAARCRLGELERCTSFLVEQGVQAPERFTRMLVPS